MSSIFTVVFYNLYLPTKLYFNCATPCSCFLCRIWPWHTRVLLGCTVTFLESLICLQLLNFLVPDHCLQSSVLYWIIYQVRWVVRSIVLCYTPEGTKFKQYTSMDEQAWHLFIWQQNRRHLENNQMYYETNGFSSFLDYRFGTENKCTARSITKIYWASFIWWWYSR